VSLGEVRFERDGETVVAVITGEVDMSNAATIRLQIAEAVTPDDDALVVDLTELDFIDSAGLHSLIELATVLDERRQQFLLCVPKDSQIGRAIEIIGLPRAIRVHADRGEALEAARTSAMESRPIPPNEDA
jgi:anti-sigma B factor antagonist